MSPIPRSCFRPDAGKTNIKQAPLLICFPQLRVSSKWTHRHLPRTAAGELAPPLPSQILSEAPVQGHQTGFSLEAKRRKWKETNGRVHGLESKTWAPHIQLYSSKWTSQGCSWPAPCSPGTCQSPREVGSLSLRRKKAVVAQQQTGRLWLARRALAPPQQKLA